VPRRVSKVTRALFQVKIAVQINPQNWRRQYDCLLDAARLFIDILLPVNYNTPPRRALFPRYLFTTTTTTTTKTGKKERGKKKKQHNATIDRSLTGNGRFSSTDPESHDTRRAS